MSTKSDLRRYFSNLKPLLRLQQRFVHTMGGGMKERIRAEKGSDICGVTPGPHDMSSWKKVDARIFGIKASMLSQSSYLVLKILRNEGYEAYLVGGCVRDMILKRTPKDFDVITTADLKQIKRAFHTAYIVGRRFPICQVNLKGSVIEVSSFKTAGSHEKEEPEAHSPKILKGCSKIDYVRWRDSSRRDFTINSLFYDPFSNKIYDYTNAMMDLKSSKLKTLIPAHMSFKEDSARILRGLRIAARLGFSFSQEMETAIHELSCSIASLPKARLMMELNYMLAYGAAEPSLSLLQRFKVLEIILPFHDAYLRNHSGYPASLKSSMLMKLFSSLDKVVTCGKPCDSLLWVGLLAFHLALVTNPQEALVVQTFSSVLYYGTWNEGVKAARERAFERVDFEPELLKSFTHLSEERLEQSVSEFASTVQDSINILTDSNSLLKAMAIYPSSPCSGLALISRRYNQEAARLFHHLENHLHSASAPRQSYEINHQLLGKGNLFEVRFVLGKVIMDTLRGEVVTDKSSATVNKRSISLSDAESTLEPIKKQKLVEKVIVEMVKTSEKLASLSKEIPKEYTVHGEQAEMAPKPIKKQKLVEKVTVKKKKTSEKLALSSKETSKENTVRGEQAEMAPKPIKKQMLMEKEQRKAMKERIVSQKLTSASKKNSEQDKALEHQAVRSLSSLFK